MVIEQQNLTLDSADATTAADATGAADAATDAAYDGAASGHGSQYFAAGTAATRNAANAAEYSIGAARFPWGSTSKGSPNGTRNASSLPAESSSYETTALSCRRTCRKPSNKCNEEDSNTKVS